MPDLPKHLQEAIERGELTEQELRELITFEAMAINLTFEEAILRARQNTLPNNHIGADISLLVELLAAA